MSKPKMMKVTEHNRAMQSLNLRLVNAKEQPIKMDISFLRPLARWYPSLSEAHKQELPSGVLNALDSLYMVLKGRL